MELWLAVICMILAFIAGIAAAAMNTAREAIGTLKVKQAEENEAPYLFLEIDEGKMQKLYSEKTVLVKAELPRKIHPSL